LIITLTKTKWFSFTKYFLAFVIIFLASTNSGLTSLLNLLKDFTLMIFVTSLSHDLYVYDLICYINYLITINKDIWYDLIGKYLTNYFSIIFVPFLFIIKKNIYVYTWYKEFIIFLLGILLLNMVPGVRYQVWGTILRDLFCH